MPEFMKKISTLVKTVDKLLNNLQKDPDDKEKV